MNNKFYIRSKGQRWDYIRNGEGKPMSFDTYLDAEIELTWRIQNDKDFVPGTYEITQIKNT